MKPDFFSWQNVCPSCGEKLEQFLVKLVCSGRKGHLSALNIACPHCGVGADVEIAELSQSLVQALRLLRV